MAMEALYKALFAIFSLLIAGSDIKTGAVPRIAFLISFPFFFILKSFLPEENSFLDSFAGAFIGLSIFLIAFAISGKKMGLADVWYSALIGLVLGPWWWYAATGSACLSGMIYLLVSKKRKIPFIPLMAVCSVAISIIKVWQ